jgi:hypothetical protein
MAGRQTGVHALILYFSARTSCRARSTSAGVIPAWRAASWTSSSNFVNSSGRGGLRALRTMTSPSPTTTKRTPDSGQRFPLGAYSGEVDRGHGGS